MAAVETRGALAPYVGRAVRCRGVIMRDDTRGPPRTFLTHLDADFGGGWERVGSHCWVAGRRLCAEFGRAVVVEFEATVRRYATDSPLTGQTVARFAVGSPRAVVCRGPAVLADIVRELVGGFGWEAVADAVERAHQGGG